MNIMPNTDPLFDLSSCASALAEGHDPAEVAIRLRGIIERLRQMRSADDERRDVLATLGRLQVTYEDAGRTHAEAKDWEGAARALASYNLTASLRNHFERGKHAGTAGW